MGRGIYKGALIMLHNVFMTTCPLVYEESVERYAAKTHVSKDCKHFGGRCPSYQDTDSHTEEKITSW